MIFDDIKNIGIYRQINSHMGKVIEWIGNTRLDGLEAKRDYPIDGKNIYAVIQEYDTSHSYEKGFEGHLKYIDIQMILSGAETMEVKLKSGDEKDDVPYDEARDIYKVKTAEEARILVRENKFVIFFPWDLHKPCVSCSYDSMRIRKLLIKISVD
jgi:YhcH/YjgK/YiaL family protein